MFNKKDVPAVHGVLALVTAMESPPCKIIAASRTARAKGEIMDFISLTRPKSYYLCFVAVLKNWFPSLDADQQRREKLRKELARCEKEFKLSKSAMQANSKMNSKFFVNSVQKVRWFLCSLKQVFVRHIIAAAWLGLQVWVGLGQRTLSIKSQGVLLCAF